MKKTRNVPAAAPAVPSTKELNVRDFNKVVAAFDKPAPARQADKVSQQLVANSFGKRRHVRGWPAL